jgi:cytochrome c-type biogenesis protein CcmH
MKRRALAVFALLTVTSAIARAQVDTSTRSVAPITAADSALDAQVAAVASTLRCPVCQGESIQDSPSELAAEMRLVVRDKLRAGKTPEEIRAYFVSRYGEWILLEPKMTGLNILLYVFPVLLVIGGLVVVGILVRRWTSTDPGVTAPDEIL